jgi:50S ribosomal protein L16 3-hydroxylase
VSARLIRQKNKDPNEWHVKSLSLTKGDFQKLPNLWTILVQAVDHYSFDVAELWKNFHLFHNGVVMTSWCLMHQKVVL